jgi:ABC-type uncharacterized transport system permease subunit
MILSLGPGLPVVAALVALAGYAVAALPGSGRRPAAALAIGWLAHAATLAIDIAGVGDSAPGARFGFAPVLSLTVWLVLAVHAVESRFLPLAGVRRVLAAMGIVVVLLVLAFPGESHVMAGSPWMPLHWILGIASYGLFGAAVLHATLLDGAERQMRMKAAHNEGPLGLPLLRLERLTFRFVEAGFVVLSAALLLGVGTTTQWRWDHKTVFSLLGWATFAGLIVGRHVSGWRGRRATRWLYVGAALLLLAYIGSRFVLEVVLRR